MNVPVERKRQAEIKERYGLTSLDHLINQLDGELIQALRPPKQR